MKTGFSLLGATALAVSLFAAPRIALADEALIQAVGGPAAAGRSSADKPAFAKRDRLVKIDADAFASAFKARAKGGTVRLDLFPGVSVEVAANGVETDADGATIIDGSTPADPLGDVTLVVGGGTVYGVVQVDGRTYEISSAGNGLHRVAEIDQAAYPGDKVLNKLLPDTRSAVDAALTQAAAGAKDDGDDERAAKSTIRVIILATAQVRAKYPTEFLNRAKASIADANKSFKNSAVKIVFSAANYYWWDYNETNVTFDKLLADVRNNTNVRNARDTDKADLVAVFRNDEGAGNAFCGLAYYTETPSRNTKDLAYGVVNIGCAVGNHSYVHEAGHNMGLLHDRYVQNAFGKNQDKYNYGYSNLAKQVRTVMAYANYCQSKGISNGCTRIGYFSNPTKSYNGGVLGVATGKVDPAYNARRLNETRKAISAYR